MRIFFTLSASAALALHIQAQEAPQVLWQNCLPPSFSPSGYTGNIAITTLDHGFAITGNAISQDHPQGGAYVAKLDSSGAVEWEVVYGDEQGLNAGYGLLQASDSGYLVLADASGDYGDVGEETQGFEDVWIFKLDTHGAMQWSQCYGGYGEEIPYGAVQTSDGHFVVVGDAQANDGDVVGNHGGGDGWVLKLDSANGEILWQECIGSDFTDMARQVLLLEDGSLMVMGSTYQGDDAQLPALGGFNLWLIKLDEDGDRVWQESYGGQDNDLGHQFCRAADGGFYMIGGTNSNDGDVSGLHGPHDEEQDGWLVKLDAAGNIEWQRCIGGTDGDAAVDVTPMANGGCVTLCGTYSNDGDVSGQHGALDAWLARWTPDGDLLWQLCLGDTLYQYAGALTTVWDDGLLVMTRGWADDELNCGPYEARVTRFAPQELNVGTGPIVTSPFPFRTLLNGRELQVIIGEPLMAGAGLVITDAAGRRVLERRSIPAMTSADVSTWAPGAYLISVESTHDRAVRRIILP